ncbi:amidohydrolase [Mycobacterium saskatchewanense]|uniref:Amidohydrolase n=2 Tax=Mycobacterium saskatchewanense TaxID=220927 RepID=A0AAJ3TTL2_9MYCO|nr:amidohydrolase [Mycobacterium saskatchewanense]
MQILSVDDHLIEPPRVFVDRVPGKYFDQVPRIIEDENNHHVWTFEGRRYPQIGLNAVAGKDATEYGTEPVRYEDMIPGCYDPIERAKDMDLDGVQAAMCYPSFPGFAGRVFLQADDHDLAYLCVQAWNDFSVGEWSGSAPGRFIPLAMVPLWDTELCVKEIERVAAMGARAITFPENPSPLGLPSFHTRHWDPVFAALQDAGLPLCLHFGSSSHVPGFASDAPLAVSIALYSTNLMATTTDLLFSGALQRHPRLKIVLAEGGIGWIPYVVERCDYVWDRHRWYQDIDKQTRPSDLFREHFYGCFIDDNFGIRVRHDIGIDNLTFEVDYPHSDSQWPNTRRYATEAFAKVPDDEVHRIVELNTRKLFRFGPAGETVDL